MLVLNGGCSLMDDAMPAMDGAMLLVLDDATPPVTGDDLP